MSYKINIDDQVAALDDVVRNHRSYINLVRRYVAKGERPKEILDDTEKRLPAVEAALKTLKWVQKNREIIITAQKSLDK
jgi:hypothetical protein